MKAYRVTASSAELLEPRSANWEKAAAETVSMVPAPLGMVAAISGVFANIYVTRVAKRERLLAEDRLTMDH